MDYKMWILLLAILLLILYIIKEVYFIKFDLLGYINTLKNNHEENNLIIRKNFQNDLNVFANKIKLLNDENLQQFRKITILNTQPIVKNNNYFKEMTYTESDNESELKYLSDNKIQSNYMEIKKDLVSQEQKQEKTVSNTSSFDSAQEKKLKQPIKTSSEKESDIVRDMICEKVSLVSAKEISSDHNISNNNINSNNNSDNNSDNNSTEKISDSVEEISFEKKDLEQPQNNLFSLGNKQEFVKINNLKSIDEYNLETLKTMAKKYNIPLSVKISGGKWKMLNKNEIYTEISKLINKNI